MRGSCSLADAKVPPVCLQVPNARVVYASAQSHETKSPEGQSRCYTVEPDAEFDIILPKSEAKTAVDAAKDLIAPARPLLYAERSFTGHGQQHGGMQAILTNPNSFEVEFVYLESLPWFMRIYLHTLSTRISSSASPTANSSALIKQIHYRPALDRARGTQLELLMRIPPRCTVFLTYDFEKSILRYTEYPPDANRGFDVAAAVIRTVEPAVMNLRTTSLLLYLPTPDFSMPYNVIIFTSTTIAFAFGGLYNILVRRLVGADETAGPMGKWKLGNLLSRLQRNR